MQYYKCECGFGSKCGGVDEEAIIRHIRESHDIDIKKGYTGNSVSAGSHYFHCNDCPRANGHGRLLGTFDRVRDHLETSHGVYGMIENF
jgi:hypothetical protein